MTNAAFSSSPASVHDIKASDLPPSYETCFDEKMGEVKRKENEDEFDAKETKCEETKEILGKEANENEHLRDTDGWIDLLGSGRVRVKIVSSVSNDVEMVKVKPGHKVTVLISARFQDSIVLPESETTIIVGDNDYIRALDLVLPILHEGCNAVFITDPEFSYGKIGLENYGIPPNAALEFSISVLKVITDFSIGNCTFADKMYLGLVKKERGNFWFKRGEYSEAIHIYRRCVEYFDVEELDLNMPIDKQQLDKQSREIINERINTLNNLAQAQISNEMYGPALTSLRQLLKTEPNNEKALYRIAKVYESKGNIDAAISCLERLTKHHRENKQATAVLKRLISRQKARLEQDVQMSRRMLGLTNTERSQPVPIGGYHAWLNVMKWPSRWRSSTMIATCVIACLSGVYFASATWGSLNY